MGIPAWFKDAFFLVTVVGGAAILGGSLVSTDRIQRPESYAPHGESLRSIQSVAGDIDLAFEAQWQQAGVQPTDPADSLQVARRLGIGLAGTIP